MQKRLRPKTALALRNNGQNRPRQKTKFAKPFNPITLVQPFCEKYSIFFFSEMCNDPAHPASLRGTYASSRTWRWDAVAMAGCAKTSALVVDGEVVWS
jgi:hypothetical protein